MPVRVSASPLFPLKHWVALIRDTSDNTSSCRFADHVRARTQPLACVAMGAHVRSTCVPAHSHACQIRGCVPLRIKKVEAGKVAARLEGFRSMTQDLLLV